VSARSASWMVTLAVLLSLALRVAGLGWGLPGPGRNYPYHPDEPLLALAVLRVDFQAVQLNPHFFNYGSLCIYLDRLAVDGAARAGLINLRPQSRADVARLIGDVIAAGRWLTVLMGVLTVAATAALGARLFGAGTGALAALLLALAPLHLAHGHYNTVDVSSALWTTLCLLLCAGVLSQPNRGALAAAGACAGLAASTKYNAGIVFIAPLFTLAATWRRGEWYASDRAAAVIYTPLAAAAAFLITTPGIFLYPDQFWHDFLYEVHHTATGHGLVFVHTPPAWLYHLSQSLPDGLGLPLAIAVVAGVVWALLRHRPEDGLLLVFVLAYYVLIGGAVVKFSRYLLPILPALLVLAARLLTGEGKLVGSNARGKAPAGVSSGPHSASDSAPGDSLTAELASSGRPVAHQRALALLLVLLWTTASGIAMAAVFARPDPRDQAADWVVRNRRRGERVGLVSQPWFYTPPLSPSLGCTHALQRILGEPVPAWIVAPSRGQSTLSPAELARSQPAYIVTSEFEYIDPLRLRAEVGKTDGTTALFDAMRDRYQLIRTFRNRPTLGPLRWFEERPPVHDLLYPMPDVRIYRLRGTSAGRRSLPSVRAGRQ
jgi:hypothetical protein